VDEKECVVYEYDGDDVIITLPSGHTERLTQDEVEMLAFMLLDALKDDLES